MPTEHVLPFELIILTETEMTVMCMLDQYLHKNLLLEPQASLFWLVLLPHLFCHHALPDHTVQIQAN